MLWLAVGIAYGGGRWFDAGARMNFVRYSGELFIYYVLIALGGGVKTVIMVALFLGIGVHIEQFFENWLLPCGALGAVVIGSWLVETKRGMMQNMAPMLTRLFTPMFTLLLLAFLATMLFTGRGLDFDRELIIALDLLLVVVLNLLLYAISARDPRCGARREPHPVGQSHRVRCALCALSAQRRHVHHARALADELPAGLCDLGGDRRDRISAAVRRALKLRLGQTNFSPTSH